MTGSAKVLLAAILVAFGVVTTIWFAAGGESDRPAADGVTPVTAPGLRLSAVVPAGWEVAGLDTERPTFALAIWSKGSPTHDDCGRAAGVRVVSQIAVSEVTESRPDDGDRMDATELTYPPRPSHFGSRAGSGIRQFTPDEDCGEHHQTIRFTDRGRRFVVQVDFEADDRVQRRSEVYELLDSLEIEPK